MNLARSLLGCERPRQTFLPILTAAWHSDAAALGSSEMTRSKTGEKRRRSRTGYARIDRRNSADAYGRPAYGDAETTLHPGQSRGHRFTLAGNVT